MNSRQRFRNGLFDDFDLIILAALEVARFARGSEIVPVKREAAETCRGPVDFDVTWNHVACQKSRFSNLGRNRLNRPHLKVAAVSDFSEAHALLA